LSSTTNVFTILASVVLASLTTVSLTIWFLSTVLVQNHTRTRKSSFKQTFTKKNPRNVDFILIFMNVLECSNPDMFWTFFEHSKNVQKYIFYFFIIFSNVRRSFLGFCEHWR
jgi:hypothetical protein